MKREFIFGTMLSAALAVGVSAQQTGQPGQQSRAGQSEGQTVTVTGCLSSGAQGSAGTSGTAGGTGTGGDTTARQGDRGARSQFILTNAKITSGGSTGTTGTAGGTATGGTESGAAAQNRFRLIAGEDQSLQQHLNKQVEVTGTLMARGSNRGGAAGTGTSGTGTGTGTGSGSMSQSENARGNVPAVRVTSVREVAPSCTSGDIR